MENNSDISITDQLDEAIHYWWVPVFIALIGAAVGWGIHQLKPPVYEARAVFSFTIDYTRTGALTDVEEDQVYVNIGDIIKSSDVINQTLVDMPEKGLVVAAEDFQSSRYLERRNQEWILRVRNGKPETAAGVVDLWAENANQVLRTALEHALNAEQLSRNLDGLTGCFEQGISVEPAGATCYENREKIQAEIYSVSQQVEQEKAGSLGLIPALKFSLVEKANIPTRPVQFESGLFILAGALAGFFVGIGMVQSGFLKRFTGKKQ